MKNLSWVIKSRNSRVRRKTGKSGRSTRDFHSVLENVAQSDTDSESDQLDTEIQSKATTCKRKPKILFRTLQDSSSEESQSDTRNISGQRTQKNCKRERETVEIGKGLRSKV